MAQQRPPILLNEYFGNIHMHTTYSDGSGTFDDLIAGAVSGRLDFVIVTDHNILVREQEEGYRRGVLTLVGQEVDDRESSVSGNHLLCLGVEKDVSNLAKNPQVLIDSVGDQNALAILAHPIEENSVLFPTMFPWRSWEVSGYHGVELWNFLSSFRGYTSSFFKTVLVAFWPHLFATGPLPAMLQKWDELTQERPVVALGGTDVHAVKYRRGPISRRFLTYEECAKSLNTHILTATPLLGQPENGDAGFQEKHVRHDRETVLNALRRGHCWVGYDLAGSTAGFRFWAQHSAEATQVPGAEATNPAGAVPAPLAIMGDTLELAEGNSLLLRVNSPETAHVRLVRNGRTISSGHTALLSYVVRDEGVYRVEVWKQRWGKLRGWIFSNPIYIRRPVTN